MARLLSRSSLVLLALLLAPACGPNAQGVGDDDDDGPDGGTGGIDASVSEQCRRMDLVFVIDDSGSMQEEQNSLATNFPMFADVLNDYTLSSGEHLDYRAAITTSGITASFTIAPPQIPGFPPIPPIMQSQVGANGKFRQTCGMTRPWLEPTDPMMATTFACAARVGTSGPAIEMPLRAAELAVTDTVNAGFVRDDALLGIVLITDEDDCSRRNNNFTTGGDACAANGDTDIDSIASYVASFDQRKGDRGRWATAVIAGPSECMSAFGSAANAIRMKDFVAQAGTNAVFGDICQGNLAPALQQALETFQIACENFPPIGREASPEEEAGDQAEAADSRSALARIRLSR
jgi:hypothetical protein